MTRFARPEQLASWAGLHESDTTVRRGRITKQGSRLVPLGVADVVGRVAIRQPKPMESVSLGRNSLQWPSLIAQQQAEATLGAAGPDPAGHRKVIVKTLVGTLASRAAVQRRHPHDHPDTLTTRHNIAALQQQTDE